MAEETEVRRGAGADAPVEFHWNGQIHRVRVVLTHHRIRHSPRPGSSTRPDLPPSPPVVDELEARRASRAAELSEPAATSPPDEEVWRVSASPSFAGGVPPAGTSEADKSSSRPAPVLAGVFDLSFDWAVGRWTVTRIDILEEEQ
ncbi:hypothetical protein [Cryptosporangium arvum]|uniref:hypothetical protein n=1 Tax=Cryptosporangium arvum TaxID=80871 RepID=UPI00056653F7|nr:hypothetical protein [Cryptosporangium arvum]